MRVSSQSLRIVCAVFEAQMTITRRSYDVSKYPSIVRLNLIVETLILYALN